MLSLRGARPIAAALALVFLVSLVAAPLGAAELPAPQTAPQPTAQQAPAQPTTLAAAAEARIEALDPAEAAAAIAPVQSQATDTAGEPGFFKTSKGIAVLALFAGGVTWTLISKSQDRVKSPIR